MANNKNFDEFLSRQSKKAKSFGNVDERKIAWIAKIDDLYRDITKILKAYIDRNQFSISREPMVLHEELLGSYEVHALKLNFGYSNAAFRPKGTYLIGTPGRVDLTGGRGIVRFILVPANVTKPTIAIRESSAERAQAWRTRDTEDQIDLRTYVWKISSNPPRIKYNEINEDTLTEAIVAVTNG